MEQNDATKPRMIRKKLFASKVPYQAFAYQDKLYGYFWYELHSFTVKTPVATFPSLSVSWQTKKIAHISSFALFSNGIELGGSRKMGVTAVYTDATGKVLAKANLQATVGDPGFSSSGAKEKAVSIISPLKPDLIGQVSKIGLSWYRDHPEGSVPTIPLTDIDF